VCCDTACGFLPAAGGGHGARCIEYAIPGVLARRSILPGCADAGGGGGGFHSPEAAWAAAANLPGRRQRLGRCPRRPHGKDSPPDSGSLARGLPGGCASHRNGARAAVQVALPAQKVENRQVGTTLRAVGNVHVVVTWAAMDADEGEGESPALGAHARAVVHVDHHRAPERACAERCGPGDLPVPLPRLQHLVGCLFIFLPHPPPLSPPIHRSSWSCIPILPSPWVKIAGLGIPLVLLGSSHFCQFPSRIHPRPPFFRHICACMRGTRDLFACLACVRLFRAFATGHPLRGSSVFLGRGHLEASPFPPVQPSPGRRLSRLSLMSTCGRGFCPWNPSERLSERELRQISGFGSF
jgi:hypothetical protein